MITNTNNPDSSYNANDSMEDASPTTFPVCAARHLRKMKTAPLTGPINGKITRPIVKVLLEETNDVFDLCNIDRIDSMGLYAVRHQLVYVVPPPCIELITL